MKIPILFCFFVIFLGVYAVKRRQHGAAQQKADDDFFERERRANMVRKKDISHLDYFTFSMENLPAGKHSDAKLHSLEETLTKLSEQKILNLSAYSNTDLKLMYGTANLPILTEYDENYHTLSSTLLAYAVRQTELERDTDAIQILEYAMHLSIDSSQIYLLLAELYQKNHAQAKIENIIQHISTMDEAFQKLVLPKLSACRTAE